MSAPNLCTRRAFRAAVFLFSAAIVSCASRAPESAGSAADTGSAASHEPNAAILIEPEGDPAFEAAYPYRTAALQFDQVWAYLIAGQESYLDYGYPLSDVGYFGAEINSYGELAGVPDRTVIAAFPGRVHLVVVCNSTALTHFCLDPASPARAPLIESLLAAAEPYDGLQIDFELVPKRDGEHFVSFLTELKSRLGDTVLSAALPARTRVIENDVYDYAKIAAVVDSVFVMAYDEHWSTSAPGAVASLDWCVRIASHATETVPPEKLVMGLPFYGRTWGSVSVNRAFYFSGIQRILRENGVKSVRRENGVPTFTYKIPSVTVTGYYDDVYSLAARLELYRAAGIRAAGFWCLGQEDPRIWDVLRAPVTAIAE